MENGGKVLFSFDLFKNKLDIDHNNRVPKLPLPHDACIRNILEIVKNQQETCVHEIDKDPNLTDAFRDRFVATCQGITNGFITKQLLGMLSTLELS